MRGRGKDAADGEISAHLGIENTRERRVVVTKSKNPGGLSLGQDADFATESLWLCTCSSLLVNRLTSVMGENIFRCCLLLPFLLSEYLLLIRILQFEVRQPLGFDMSI